MAGLSSFLALVLGVTLWAVLADDPYVAPPPGERSPGVQAAGAAATLQLLSRAIEDGRPEEAAALAADGDDGTAARLAALVENASSIGLEVDLRYVDEMPTSTDPGKWSATVATTWQITGVDPRPAEADVRFDFTAQGDQVVVAGVGGRGATTPVWMSGPIGVRRDGNVVVLAAGRADHYARLTRRAVVVVRRVLPGWDGVLVLEVPRHGSDVDAALDVERGTFRNVAGVTAAADGSGSSASPVHVFLNPEQMRDLRPVGAQIVVSHEAVHVAVDAPTSEMPVWLSEGFADYVALRDVDLPLSTTAAQVIDQVRRRGVPQALPDDGDFDEQSDRFGAAYEAAWLACRLLVEQEGEPTLLQLYRRADAADNFGQVFRTTTGLSMSAFTAQWREHLREIVF